MAKPGLELVGEDQEVPLVGGAMAPHINLDFAASAPALRSVADAVDALMPWYSSVHRGKGFKSQVSTLLYESARESVARFVNARQSDVVIFTRNTTDALNLLGSALPPETSVVVFGTEHHANMLPWRRARAVQLPPPPTPEAAVAALGEALHDRPAPCLVAVTAASNVTGEIWPVTELVEVAHAHGAKVVVDAAQLAPHAPVDLTAWDADWVAMSGHKLYAPYGAGVIVGREDWLSQGAPFLAGGGAVAFVSADDVEWAKLPDRQEAGSPNVVGAVALAAACNTLRTYGMGRVAEAEAELTKYITKALASIEGLHEHRLWSSADPKIGVFTFTIDGVAYGKLAAALSAEYGIAVRDGRFCSHPLMLHLLGIPARDSAGIRERILAGDHEGVPGAVRISTGLGTTKDHIDTAVEALRELASRGPKWDYKRDEKYGDWVPVPDDRERDDFAEQFRAQILGGPDEPGRGRHVT